MPLKLTRQEATALSVLLVLFALGLLGMLLL